MTGAVPGKSIHVSINASGKRIVGSIELPVGFNRLSDLLNAPDPAICVTAIEQELTQKRLPVQVIFKESITFVEAMDEPRHTPPAPPTGLFAPIVGELIGSEGAQLLAELYVPEGMTLFEVLNDPKWFVIMRNVHFSNFMEKYTFLAVNKKALILVKG